MGGQRRPANAQFDPVPAVFRKMIVGEQMDKQYHDLPAQSPSLIRASCLSLQINSYYIYLTYTILLTLPYLS